MTMAEAVWHKNYQLDELALLCRGNMVDHLGIQITSIGTDTLVGTMPVDYRTTQSAGILHGGASVALAESLGSIAANLCVDPARCVCVGQEINASHLRPVRQGLVTGTARPAYLGRSSQVWEIEITDERQRKVCLVRLTVAVVTVGYGGGKVKFFD